jgi:hypothetical protein
MEAVDEDKLRVVAIGGRPPRIIRLDPELTNIRGLGAAGIGEAGIDLPVELVDDLDGRDLGSDDAAPVAFRIRSAPRLAQNQSYGLPVPAVPV